MEVIYITDFFTHRAQSLINNNVLTNSLHSSFYDSRNDEKCKMWTDELDQVVVFRSILVF